LLAAVAPNRCGTPSAEAKMGGGKPWSSLIMDNAGNLYGTALEGGTSNDGVVFEIRLH